MKSERGIASIAILLAIPVLCVCISYAASKIFGPTDETTEEIEQETEYVIEDELKMPKGSLKNTISAILPHNET